MKWGLKSTNQFFLNVHNILSYKHGLGPEEGIIPQIQNLVIDFVNITMVKIHTIV